MSQRFWIQRRFKSNTGRSDMGFARKRVEVLVSQVTTEDRFMRGFEWEPVEEEGSHCFLFNPSW